MGVLIPVYTPIRPDLYRKNGTGMSFVIKYGNKPPPVILPENLC
jgi:hypothetical protein